MKLAPGQTLLHYRIVDKIGEGGMGVVWRATDTRLGRDVAIKILPETHADDPERLGRFEREARAMASLNHPSIVTIHGVEKEGTTPFLVMELIKGDPLASLIPDEGLPPDRLIDLAVAIADGIVEAHRQGVTHRDLKPGNVVVTDDGRPKILDFGLAKLIAGDAPSGTEPVDEATRTVIGPTTTAGVVLGTTAYMSPEQVEGRPVDSRSDIFSFGVMLYEMATGRRPFQGGTAARLIAAVLTEDPPSLAEARPDHPASLDHVVRRCLEKDPEARFRTAGELRDQLKALRDEPSGATKIAGDTPEHEATGTAVGSTRRRSPWLLAAFAGIAGIALMAVFLAWQAGGRRAGGEPAPTPSEPGPSPFATRSLSQLTFDAATEKWPAWSPTDSRLVYCKESEGFSKLFLLDTETDVVRQLTLGSRDDIQPAWSPNGDAILFVRSSIEGGSLQPDEALTGTYSNGDVWRLELETGDENRIIENAYNPAFSPDGTLIAVDASWAGPRRIWTTDARGHNPRQVTTGTSEAIEHANPAWSPDGSHVVYQHTEKTKQDIHVAALSGGSAVAVTDDLYLDADPVWSKSGHVVMASYRGGGLNIWRVPVEPDGRSTGTPEQLTTGAGQDIQPALASDGERLAFTVLLQNSDLWRLSTDPATGQAGGPPEPLIASTREDSRGAWSPDSSQVAFNSDRDGEMNLWVHSLTDGTTRRLTRGPGGDYQPDWSSDGKSIAFFSARSGNADIWIVDVVSGELRQVTEHPALDTNPFFSPEGDRIAFQSDRDGRKEVWVIVLAGGPARQVATVGASDHFMRWSDDGQHLYFRSTTLPENCVCRVSVDSGEIQPLGIPTGWHMSFSPDRSLLLDAMRHQGLWVYPLDGSPRREVFGSSEPGVRIDYPEWSPDGRWVVFDRVAPRGGDIWLLEGVR